MDNKLTLTISLAFIAAVYSGLSVLFYTPESGFAWAVTFFLLSLGVLVLFVSAVIYLSRRELDRIRKEANSENQQTL